MVWKCYFGPYGITIFTRPVDYLIWFAVWGNSYMLRDIYLNINGKQKKTAVTILIKSKLSTKYLSIAREKSLRF